MKDFRSWGIKSKNYPKLNYKSVWYNLQTIRFGIGSSLPLPPDKAEFYDISLGTKCNVGCEFCYAKASKDGKNFSNVCEKIKDFFKNTKLEDRPYQIAIGVIKNKSNYSNIFIVVLNKKLSFKSTKMTNNVTIKYNKIKGIYKIKNNINNKFYIGSSVNLRKRVLDHIRELRKDIHHNKHLQSSYNLYGDKNFSCDVVVSFENFYMPVRILREIETVYIQYYKCYDDEIGYNIESVGLGTTNKSFSKERKQKISNALKGRKCPNKGVPITEEQRLKLIDISTKRCGKAVLVYDMFGNFVERFESVSKAAKKYKVIKRDIIDACRYRKATCKDHIFRYENSLDPGEDYWLNKYIRNKTKSPFYFELLSPTGKIVNLKYVSEVEEFLGCCKKDKKLCNMLKQIYDGKTTIYYKNYKIRFKYALSWSDPTKELRQPPQQSGV